MVQRTAQFQGFYRLVHQQVTLLTNMLFQVVGVIGRDHDDRRGPTTARVDRGYHVHAILVVIKMVVRQDQIHPGFGGIKLALQIRQ